MTSTNITKITLYKMRTAGEVISDTFGFITSHFQMLLKNILLLLLPLCLLQALVFMLYVDALASITSLTDINDQWGLLLQWGAIFVAFLLIALLSQLLLASLVFAVIQRAEQSDQGLLGVRLANLKPMLNRNMKCMLALVGIGIVLGLLLVGLMGALFMLIGAWSGVVLMLVIVLLLSPLTLLTPVYVLEEHISLWQAVKKALRLGMSIWGKVVGVVLVVYIICSIGQTIFSLPWYILFVAKAMMLFGGDAADLFVDSWIYLLLTYLAALLLIFAGMMVNAVLYVCQAYLYGHAVEKDNQQNAASDY